MKSKTKKSDFNKRVLLAAHSDLTDEIVDGLIQCRYFKTMTAETLRMVLKSGEYLEAPPDVSLIHEGALDDDMFFLLEGSLAVKSGEKVIIRFNTPGDVVGEFAVVSDQPRSADVVTETPSRLVRVSTSFLRRWSANPKLVVEFYTIFSHIMYAKLGETSARAKLYEDSVLEVQEFATATTKLESTIQDKLKEIKLYSNVIESSNAAVLITNTDGEIIHHNPAASKMLQDLDIELNGGGGKIMKLVKDFDLSDYPKHEFGTPWQGEWSKTGEEETLVLLVTVTPITAADHSLVNVAFQMTDISLEKAQEKILEMKNEEIRNALASLEETYQEMQRTDLLKTETLTAISSELTAPIRKILTHSGKLNQTYQEIPKKELKIELDAIYEQGELLKLITENIGYLIELQNDLTKLGREPVDLKEILGESMESMAGYAKQRAIKFKVKLPEEPMTLNGDAAQFRRIFSLIIEQALLVGKKKSPLNVEAEFEEKSDQLTIEFSYQGPTLKNLNPLDGQLKGRMGLLIGIPLARKVISQYQGSIQFMGDKKQGIIKVVLPRLQRSGEERPNRVVIMDSLDMDRMITKGVIDHLWPEAIILSTDNPYEFLDNYEDFKPDLIIIDPDIVESGWNNHRVLAALLQNRRHTCPILAVSGLYKDFAERTIAVERGVNDFLEKPFSIFDLRFKVKSLLQSHRKEESLHHTMDQAQRQAYTDALTRLANRKHFDEFLETQIEYSRQTGKPCSLIMLDVDNFKHYNDTNGHQFGDEVLRGIGRILALSVRSSDLAARYGGEEFVLVLPETRKEMALVVAEKVRRTIEEENFPNGEKQPLGYVSASLGVSTFDEDANSVEELIKAADDSLYLAKEQGRNRVVLADGPPQRSEPLEATS
ncbi:MAG: diguanylate cyclase [SAR324 cluster bacterium]|nr:diguanylate cyclase [SAR324 cluster bacterium]